jgi:hypothetical protein
VIVAAKRKDPIPTVQVEGMRPEAKAAKSLRTFFTMVAVRIVLDQVSFL